MLRERVRRGVDIALVVGADQVQEFETWKDYRTLAEEFSLILTTRSGYPENLRRGKDYLRSAEVVEIPDVAVSSTMIRRRVREGRSIRYLVPEKVEKYIRERGLYG
jgi:nicotinate-nucleotide adenylyltransferase